MQEEGRENFLKAWYEHKGFAEEWQKYQRHYLEARPEEKEVEHPYGDFSYYLKKLSGCQV